MEDEHEVEPPAEQLAPGPKHGGHPPPKTTTQEAMLVDGQHLMHTRKRGNQRRCAFPAEPGDSSGRPLRGYATDQRRRDGNVPQGDDLHDENALRFHGLEIGCPPCLGKVESMTTACGDRLYWRCLPFLPPTSYKP